MERSRKRRRVWIDESVDNSTISSSSSPFTSSSSFATSQKKPGRSPFSTRTAKKRSSSLASSLMSSPSIPPSSPSSFSSASSSPSPSPSSCLSPSPSPSPSLSPSPSPSPSLSSPSPSTSSTSFPSTHPPILPSTPFPSLPPGLILKYRILCDSDSIENLKESHPHLMPTLYSPSSPLLNPPSLPLLFKTKPSWKKGLVRCSLTYMCEFQMTDSKSVENFLFLFEMIQEGFKDDDQNFILEDIDPLSFTLSLSLFSFVFWPNDQRIVFCGAKSTFFLICKILGVKFSNEMNVERVEEDENEAEEGAWELTGKEVWKEFGELICEAAEWVLKGEDSEQILSSKPKAHQLAHLLFSPTSPPRLFSSTPFPFATIQKYPFKFSSLRRPNGDSLLYLEVSGGIESNRFPLLCSSLYLWAHTRKEGEGDGEEKGMVPHLEIEVTSSFGVSGEQKKVQLFRMVEGGWVE